MPRMLWLHGQFLPARKYQETLLVPLLSSLADWEVTYLQSPRRCADPPPDLLGQTFPGTSILFIQTLISVNLF